MKHIEVKTGEGLGDIKFGITKDALVELLGQPDEKDGFSYDEGDDNDTEAWHYDEFELSFSFDKDDDWRLGTIASSSEATLFEGEKIIGLDVDSLLNLLKHKGIDAESEDLSTTEIPNHHVVVVEQESINFWFEDGKLSEIQWSPMWADEETIIWPN